MGKKKTDLPKSTSSDNCEVDETGLEGKEGAIPQKLSESVYYDERKILIDAEQKSADQHDKAILTLAAGGLALSITFLERIAPSPLSCTLWLVGCSWICFIACLFAILASFLTSQWACTRQREILAERFFNGNSNKSDKNCWSCTTYFLNIVSYGLFIFAVIFLAFFSWNNITVKGDQVMADEKEIQREIADVEPERKTAGYVPPKAPASPPPSDENKSKPADEKK